MSQRRLLASVWEKRNPLQGTDSFGMRKSVLPIAIAKSALEGDLTLGLGCRRGLVGLGLGFRRVERGLGFPGVGQERECDLLDLGLDLEDRGPRLPARA